MEAGENLGFLPGDLKEKLDPYLQPLYDALRDMLPTQKLLSYLEDGTIEVAPLAFMRGRTLDHSFAILDEAQTRIKPAKNVPYQDGQIFQIHRNWRYYADRSARKKNQDWCTPRILKGIQGMEFIYLDRRDIVRHRLVVKIIDA